MSRDSAHSGRLAFDDLGHGEPALLLLTGWCSSRARWAEAAPLLARNRRVVSFEWRGHGDSAPAGGDFGTAEMVDDALAMLDATGLDTVIPCSASHSGWVAIELRRRLGERVPAIAHLDWMVIEPSPPYMQLIGELQSETTWEAARNKLFEIWRGGIQNDQIEAALGVMQRQDAEMWIRSGREIEASYRAQRCPLEALSALDQPPRVRHIYGQPPTPEYFDAQQRFAGEHPWFDVRRLEHVRTHFAMLEAPDEVAGAIEELVVEATPA